MINPSYVDGLELRIKELSIINAELRSKLNANSVLKAEILAIINDSLGVAGYHLNGDIAEWDEFDLSKLVTQSPEEILKTISEIQRQSAEAGWNACLQWSAGNWPLTTAEEACKSFALSHSKQR